MFMKYTELILKVSSICNLNCDYCYVFNKGDTSYKREPPLLKMELIKPIVHRISQHCDQFKIENFIVIFHGGEPLLESRDFYKSFVYELNQSCMDTRFSYGVQTNATLLAQEWIDFFTGLNVQIGVSVDGTRKASSHRVYRSNGMEAYDNIIRGLSLIKRNNLPVSTLSVMNVEVSPIDVYDHLKSIGVDYADFLYPDMTFDSLVDSRFTSWIIELFDRWYDDITPKPIIRYFDFMIKMLLGENVGYEMLGRGKNRTLCIKTNGDIEIVDSMKVCGNKFTHTGFNVRTNSFLDLEQNEILRMYYLSHSDEVLCMKCRKCTFVNICGGGKLPHRFSVKNGFKNPSVYCQCNMEIISHVKSRLYSDLERYIKTKGV